MSVATTTRPTTDTPTPLRRRRMTKRPMRKRLPYVLAAIVLGVVCLIWIYPFLWMVSASLKGQLEVFSSGLSLVPDSPKWGNYHRAWSDANFGTYLLNTVLVTVFTVAIVVVRSAMAGYVLARYRFLGRRMVLGVLVATLFVPTGLTIIPVVDLSDRLGLLNSLGGMIVAMAGAQHVAGILLYVGYFRRIPNELEEAAVIDGAGFLRIFFQVMLPLAKPVTATVTLLTFLWTWNSFFLPLVFTFSRPDLRTVSVGMLAFVGENSTDWSGMAAAATLSMLPVVILFFVLQRFFVEGIAGAVKS
jgi:raffinose/stachyose/melibiose transport system permease protein